MTLMIKALLRAVGSLPSGAMIKIAVVSMLLNAVFMAVLVGAVYWLLGQFNWFGWFDRWLDAGFTFVAGIIAYFAYPLLLPLIISFFDTAIADAVERDEYPQLPSRQPPYWPSLLQDIKFVGKVIAINLIILPLYLLPVINFALYYVVNGYLLGTEFFNIVAGRHIGKAQAQELRRVHRVTIIAMGTLITIGSTIPFVNLIAPMLAVIVMVHFFHALKPPYKSLQPPSPPQS